MTPFEIAQVVTGVIAILLSIASLIYTNHISKKQTKLKMKENYYQPVFQKMLLVTFPNVFTSFIDIKNNTVYIEASNDFEKAIGEFRKKIKFLQFIDITVYNNIDSLLVKIDDDIVLLCSDRDNKEEKIKEIHNLVNQVYDEINKYYK